MKEMINKMHKITRMLDVGLCGFLCFWLAWAVHYEKSALYLTMIAASIAINILMIVFQPSKKVTDRLLASGIKKRSA